MTLKVMLKSAEMTEEPSQSECKHGAGAQCESRGAGWTSAGNWHTLCALFPVRGMLVWTNVGKALQISLGLRSRSVINRIQYSTV